MKKGSQHSLMEVKEFLDSLLIKEDRNAAIVFKKISDLLCFSFILRNDTRPSYPNYLDHLSFLSQLKHSRV